MVLKCVCYLQFINFTQRYKKINIAMHISLTFKTSNKLFETLSREMAPAYLLIMEDKKVSLYIASSN